MPSRALARGVLVAFLGFFAPEALAAPPAKKPVVKPDARSKKAVAKKRKLPSLAVSAPTRRRPAAVEEGQERSASPRAARSGRRRKKEPPAPKVDRFPPMKLEAINTKERLTLRLYDRRGRVLKPSVRKLWHLLRCHVSGLERPINWRLVRQLYRVSRRYPGKAIQVFSGLRAKRVAALPNSNHIKGRAVDFHVAGVANTTLRDFLLQSCRPCGVGYYPKGLFVHLDVRERQSAFWVDYSAKGEKSEYASNPYQVLRGEKNPTSKARKENGAGAVARKVSPASRPASEAPDPEPPPESEAKPEVAKPEEKPGGDSADANRATAPTAEIPRPTGRVAPPAL